MRRVNHSLKRGNRHFEAWRRRVSQAVADSGIRPATVAVEGLTTEGYYEIQLDGRGKPVVDGVETWRPWPDVATRRRIIAALRGVA